MRLPATDESGSVNDDDMEDTHRCMARDAEHEREAEEWSEALIGDAIDAD